MSNPTFEILFILLLIVANGILALSEIAVVSARKVRLHQRADRGDVKARAALELANAPGDFLSTVQVGITLVSILTGAFGGATLVQALAARLKLVPALAPYSEALSWALVIPAITYLSLVIGELVPKRLGLNNPERIAAAVAIPMRGLSAITAPAVRLLSASTELVFRLLGVKRSTEPPITEEEIKILLQQGAQAGVFHEAEQEMIERVFRLGDRRVSTLMRPRSEVVWLDLEDPPEETRRRIIAGGHSLYPVHQGTYDQVVGIAYAKDLLRRCLLGEPFDLRTAAQPPLFVPESARALKLLETFKQTGQRAALVLDEYGGTQGLVTPTDILEAIVGEIPPAGGQTEPLAVQRDDGSWLIDGMLPVDELTDLLGLRTPQDEPRGDYETVGGLVMTHLGRIPVTGDQFEWNGLRFEVIDMDGHRVDKVLVTPVSE